MSFLKKPRMIEITKSSRQLRKENASSYDDYRTKTFKKIQVDTLSNLNDEKAQQGVTLQDQSKGLDLLQRDQKQLLTKDGFIVPYDKQDSLSTSHPFFDPAIQSLARSSYKLRLKNSYQNPTNKDPTLSQKGKHINLQSQVSSSDYCFYISQKEANAINNVTQQSIAAATLLDKSSNNDDAMVRLACPGQDLEDVSSTPALIGSIEQSFQGDEIANLKRKEASGPYYERVKTTQNLTLGRKVNYTRVSSSTQRVPQQFLIKQQRAVSTRVDLKVKRQPNTNRQQVIEKLERRQQPQVVLKQKVHTPHQTSEFVVIDQNSACLNTNSSVQQDNDATANQTTIGELIAKTDTSVRSDSVEEMQALLHNAKETNLQMSSGTYGGSLANVSAAFNQTTQAGLLKHKISVAPKIRRNVLSKLSKRGLTENDEDDDFSLSRDRRPKHHLVANESLGQEKSRSTIHSGNRNHSVQNSPMLRPSFKSNLRHNNQQNTLGNDEQQLLRLDMKLQNQNRYERPIAMAMTLQKKDKIKVPNLKEVTEKTLINHFNTQSRQLLQEVLNSSQRNRIDKSQGTLLDKNLRQTTQAVIKDGVVLNKKQIEVKASQKRGSEDPKGVKYMGTLRRKYSLPYAEPKDQMTRYKPYQDGKIQLAQTPPINNRNSNNGSNASSELIPPFTFNQLESSRMKKNTAKTSTEVTHPKEQLIQANRKMDIQKAKKDGMLIGQQQINLPLARSSHPNAKTYIDLPERYEDVEDEDDELRSSNKTPHQLATQQLTTNQQLSEESGYVAAVGQSSVDGRNQPKEQNETGESSKSQYRPEHISKQYNVTIHGNVKQGTIGSSKKLQQNNDLIKEQVVSVGHRSRQNFNVKIASNKTKQSVQKVADDSQAMAKQEPKTVIQPVMRNNLKNQNKTPEKEKELEKGDNSASKETLGTHSQGSQANFAPLPNLSKFGLDPSQKDQKNINILELLQMPAADQASASRQNTCSRREREAKKTTKPTIYPGLLPQSSLINSRRSDNGSDLISSSAGYQSNPHPTIQRPATTVAYYQHAIPIQGPAGPLNRQTSMNSEVSSSQYNLVNSNDIVGKRAIIQTADARAKLNKLRNGGQREGRMPIPSTYQMTQPSLNVVTNSSLSSQNVPTYLNKNTARRASAGIIVSRKHNNAKRGNGNKAELAVQYAESAEQPIVNGLTDPMITNETYQTVRTSARGRGGGGLATGPLQNLIRSKAVKQKNMLTLIKQGKEKRGKSSKQFSVSGKSTTQNKYLTTGRPSTVNDDIRQLPYPDQQLQQQQQLAHYFQVANTNSYYNELQERAISTAPAVQQRNLMVSSSNEMDGGVMTQVNWDLPSNLEDNPEEMQTSNNNWLLTEENVVLSSNKQLVTTTGGNEDMIGFNSSVSNFFLNHQYMPTTGENHHIQSNMQYDENNYHNMIINGVNADQSSGLLIFPTDLTQVTNVSQLQTLQSPAKRVKSACNNLYKNKKGSTQRVRKGATATLKNLQKSSPRNLLGTVSRGESSLAARSGRGLDRDQNTFRQLTMKATTQNQMSYNTTHAASNIMQQKPQPGYFNRDRKSSQMLPPSHYGALNQPNSYSPICGSAIMLQPRPYVIENQSQRGTSNNLTHQSCGDMSRYHGAIRLKQSKKRKNYNQPIRKQRNHPSNKMLASNSHRRDTTGLDYQDHSSPQSRQFSTVKKNYAGSQVDQNTQEFASGTNESESGSRHPPIRQTQTLVKDDPEALTMAANFTAEQTPKMFHMTKHMRESVNEVQDLIQEIQVPVVEVVKQHIPNNNV